MDSLLDVYADLISPADRGEKGELGENPRHCWADDGANEGRTGAKRPHDSPGIRPDSPAIRPAESRAVAGDSPNSPNSPAPTLETEGDVYELRAAAGPDWPAIKDNPEALEALRRALEVRRLREQGIPPSDYTQASPTATAAAPCCCGRAPRPASSPAPGASTAPPASRFRSPRNRHRPHRPHRPRP
jgi:hypothetical protein